MKHRFLLDENILHFAIKGLNEQGQPDETSVRLTALIGLNCHTIVVNHLLLERYSRQMKRIQQEGSRAALERVSFIKQLFFKAEKWAFEQKGDAVLPAGIVVPRKDLEIVELAFFTETVIVTGDEPLRLAVNKSPELHIRAITPPEALALAADT